MTENEAERSVVEPDLIRSSFTHNKCFCLALPVVDTARFSYLFDYCWQKGLWWHDRQRHCFTIDLTRIIAGIILDVQENFIFVALQKHMFSIVIFSCDTKIQYLDIFSRLHVMDSVGMFSQTFFCVIDVLVRPREWGHLVWLFFNCYFLFLLFPYGSSLYGHWGTAPLGNKIPLPIMKCHRL